MRPIEIQPPDGPLDALVTLPGSKSLTNRAMVLAALANERSVLSNALFAEDTRHMIDALRALGFAVSDDPHRSHIEITGRGGHIPSGDADIQCGNSGTTIRFCTALAALGHGVYRFDGVQRMRERPIGQLVDALAALGAGFEFHGQEGFPPLTVHARGLAGGQVVFEHLASSQFLSALLLAAPAAGNDILIDVNGPLVSAPYVSMTMAMMNAFGVAVISDFREDRARLIVPAPQSYRAREYSVEPDASNASYFLAAPAVAGGNVTVTCLGTSSIQGDSAFVEVLEQMGCAIERAVDQLTVHGPADGSLHAVDLDLNAMPDMVLTVAVLALFADGETTVRNVANLRDKETDRLAALTMELTKLGATVTEFEDGLRIVPPRTVARAAIDTYGDHRMAMSFALVGLRHPGVVINKPQCVRKTFPDFFEKWRQMSQSRHA